MLILTRHPDQTITVGEDITVTVLSVHRNQVRLAIAAPREVKVLREELYRRSHPPVAPDVPFIPSLPRPSTLPPSPVRPPWQKRLQPIKP